MPVPLMTKAALNAGIMVPIWEHMKSHWDSLLQSNGRVWNQKNGKLRYELVLFFT